MARCEPWYVRVGRPPLFTAFRLGAWRLFGHYTGDAGTMGVLDQAFWAYKRDRPLAGRRRARRRLAGALAPGRHVVDGSIDDGTTMVFVGDVMPLGPFCAGRPSVEPSVDAAAALRCDVLFANLEGPVGALADDEWGGGLLGGAPRLAMSEDELATHIDYLRAGADTLVVSTANNHSWDLGAGGVGRTLDLLRQHQVVVAGTWPAVDLAADHVSFRTADRAVGVVSFTFGTNGLGGSAQQEPMVNVTGLNDRDVRGAADRLVTAVQRARSAGCELVVVGLHWGLEFEWYPTVRQIELARRLVDAGADIIWGHHPHIVQPVEIHQRTGGTGAGLIIYSAGNLVTPATMPHTRLSLAVRVTVDAAHRLRVVELVPLVFTAGSADGSYRLDTLVAAPDRTSAARIADQLRTATPMR